MNSDADLAALRAAVTTLLNRPGASQEAIASACDVDQGLISRIRNGRIKRATNRVCRVEAYVNMQLNDIMPKAIETAVRSYLAAGGDPNLLCEQIRILCQATTGAPGLSVARKG